MLTGLKRQTSVWIFETVKNLTSKYTYVAHGYFWRRSAAKPYVVRSTIGYHSNSWAFRYIIAVFLNSTVINKFCKVKCRKVWQHICGKFCTVFLRFFSEYNSENMKIGPHLPKLLQKSRGHVFWTTHTWYALLAVDPVMSSYRPSNKVSKLTSRPMCNCSTDYVATGKEIR